MYTENNHKVKLSCGELHNNKRNLKSWKKVLILGVKVSFHYNQIPEEKCEKQEPGTMLLLIHAALQTYKTARGMETSLTAIFLGAQRVV